MHIKPRLLNDMESQISIEIERLPAARWGFPGSGCCRQMARKLIPSPPAAAVAAVVGVGLRTDRRIRAAVRNHRTAGRQTPAVARTRRTVPVTKVTFRIWRALFDLVY